MNATKNMLKVCLCVVVVVQVALDADNNTTQFHFSVGGVIGPYEF